MKQEVSKGTQCFSVESPKIFGPEEGALLGFKPRDLSTKGVLHYIVAIAFKPPCTITTLKTKYNIFFT